MTQGTANHAQVLVVDDDAAVVDYLVEELAAAGYDARGVTSPHEALAAVRAAGVDLLVADIEMPGMRGLDLLAAVHAERPGQLVLLMTAFGSIDLAVQAVKAGACDFLTKPFPRDVLLQAVSRALRERQWRREVVRLRHALSANGGRLVARSSAMRAVLDMARRAARSRTTVLLTGETGTGKSTVARVMHEEGPRKDRPFVEVNCATLPAALAEGELFGVRRGAYTDAREDRDGLFVAANTGTLFLDEVGELSLDVQAKLLHVLENGRVRALGATREVTVDVRVIAATNRPLEELLRDGRFRPDLYYRLNVIPIEVPPLRARRDDIVPLVDRFLENATDGGRVVGVSAAALKRLMRYHWPGNVRELGNVIERAVALGEHDVIVPEDLHFLTDAASVVDDAAATGGYLEPLETVELAHIRRVLDACGGNKSAAARQLGINRRTLDRKLQVES